MTDDEFEAARLKMKEFIEKFWADFPTPDPRMSTVIRDPDPDRSFRESNPDLFDGTMERKIREILK